MIKKSVVIFLVLLGLFITYIKGTDTSFDADVFNKEKHLVDSKDKQIQPKHSFNPSKQSIINRSVENSIADSQPSNLSIAEKLDRLLASDELNDFSKSQLLEVEKICNKKRHSLSELACLVLQHQIQLVKQQDDNDIPLESDWHSVEQSGGGIELEEKIDEVRVLETQQLTSESGRLGEDQEATLENLNNRALLDHSANVRFKAIQEAVFMKSEATVPLLREALHDEILANKKLAEEGLRQLQGTQMIQADSTNNSISLDPNSEYAHASLADR